MKLRDDIEKPENDSAGDRIVEDLALEQGDMKMKASGLNVDFEAINNDLPEPDGEGTGAKKSSSEDSLVLEEPKSEIMQGETLVAETINIKDITTEDRYRIGDADAQQGDQAGKEEMVTSMTPGGSVSAVISTLDRQQMMHRGKGETSAKNDAVFKNKIVINRYPGKLYVEINRIERFLGSTDVEAVSIMVESRNFSYESKKVKASPSIEIGELLEIPIEKIDDVGFALRFVLVLHHKKRGLIFKRENTKACEMSLLIDSNRIYSVHNNLVENVSRWDHYVSSNLLKNLGNFFTASSPDAWSLKTYLSFISDDELPFIPAQVPYDLRSLSKWLTVKKFSYNMWYKGFVNIRGDIPGILTHLWKRRYIKCYGYSIFIFNEHSKNLIGTINLADSCFDPGVQKELYFENFIKLSFSRNIIEMHFDSKAKYNASLSVLTAMLPKAIFGIGK
jgi:hypothetical protein